MKHSIIAWDCCYRRFHHLLNSLALQDYPADEYELIYIEQRTREKSNRINHQAGLESLEDRAQAVEDKMNIRVEYLGDQGVFHWGKLVNHGVELAQGEYISPMDGDMLVPDYFLEQLTQFHETNPGRVVNLHRKGAQYPVGVLRYRDWFDANAGFDTSLRACMDPFYDVPDQTGFIGPLISAHQKYWEMVGGHDTHPLWATPVSCLGGDLTDRLEIVTGEERATLQDCFAVHPWHPSGTNTIRDSDQERVAKYRDLQSKLRNWAKEHEESHYKPRLDYADRLYEEHEELVNWMHNRKDLVPDGITEVPDRTTLPAMARVKLRQGEVLLRKVANALR